MVMVVVVVLEESILTFIKAVELDDLSPVDDLVKHSSSAVDIRTVLMQVHYDSDDFIFLELYITMFFFNFFLYHNVLLQIKTFWAQLSWPDVESSYAYISKILDVSFCFYLYFDLILYLIPYIIHIYALIFNNFFSICFFCFAICFISPKLLLLFCLFPIVEKTDTVTHCNTVRHYRGIVTL